MGDVEGRRDLAGLHERRQVLATRISEVEECISVHRVREFMHRIMHIETRIGSTGGVIGETIRNCLMRLDQQLLTLRISEKE